MATRADICAAALQWQGTPYHHAAQVRGIGTDCIGLLIGVAREVGLLPQDWRPPVYSPQWNLHQNTEVLLGTLDVLGAPYLALTDRQPGDITLYKFGRTVSHAAILLPGNRIIHAVRNAGRVVTTGLTGEWLTRLHACYAFPHVEDICASSC